MRWFCTVEMVLYCGSSTGLQIGIWTDGYMSSASSEAEVKSTSELKVNNLPIQRALVVTAKASGVGSTEAKELTSYSPKKRVTYLMLPFLLGCVFLLNPFSLMEF